jgi:ribosome modulation factor
MDATPWQNGFNAGRLGKPLEACPYQAGSMEAWQWSYGFVEGCSKPLRSVTDQRAEGEDTGCSVGRTS